MRKTYIYENAVVEITFEEDSEILRKATKDFLRRVVKETRADGNGNKTGNFGKEQVLDR